MSKLPDWIQAHIDLYREDPEKGHLWDSSVVGGPGPLPCLLLTTIGRKSGKKRTLPLLYGECDGGLIIVASKGGAPAHPLWYLNLVANPQVEVQVASEVFSAEAKTVSDDDRERYWDLMAKIWPFYNDYQAKTDRQIPLVFLRPLKKS